MPFLVVTGGPACGKTTIVDRIVKYFEERQFSKIVIIKDDQGLNFNRAHYNDSHKERMHRNALRSEVQKHLSKETLVICDALNYIKGFRYELFCIAKQSQTTYAVLLCDSNVETSQFLNAGKLESESYPEEKIEELYFRYERPDGKNRWDSPLFAVSIFKTNPDNPSEMEEHLPRNVELPLEDIYSWLIEGKELKANLSTQTAPISSTSFLHDLDKITQAIVKSIIEQQRNAVPGDELIISSNTNAKIKFYRIRTLAELSRLRNQFINYTKSHPVEGSAIIASLFVDFLNSMSQ
uniref:Protein KTI12 homolog n=1 Tax=Acrobeloides nanus TaxID=290746 RepID=A0A914CE64_9BILA